MTTTAPSPESCVGGRWQPGTVAPLLVRCDDPGRVEPHEVEAFGPVSTVMPYDGVDDAVALLARGEGSLVASVVTHDGDFARDVVLGAGAHHGLEAVCR